MSRSDLIMGLQQAVEYFPPQEEAAKVFNRYKIMDATAIYNELRKNDHVKYYLVRYGPIIKTIISDVEDVQIWKDVVALLDNQYPDIIQGIATEMEHGRFGSRNLLRDVVYLFVSDIRGD